MFSGPKLLFLRGEVVGLTPNLQPGGPGYPVLSGSSSPLTCPAWETLPIDSYATAGIALRIRCVIPSEISGFRSGVIEAFALFGCYAT
jgi:hypothetical protein